MGTNNHLATCPDLCRVVLSLHGARVTTVTPLASFPLCMLTHLSKRQGPDVLSVHDDAPAGQVDHSEQSHQECGLAGAGAPNDADLQGCGGGMTHCGCGMLTQRSCSTVSNCTHNEPGSLTLKVTTRPGVLFFIWLACSPKQASHLLTALHVEIDMPERQRPTREVAQ